jgi:hypothetical protein
MSDQYQAKLEKIFSSSYTPKKQSLNVRTAESDPDKDEVVGTRSGNQDTPVPSNKEKFLGTNSSGNRDKIKINYYK